MSGQLKAVVSDLDGTFWWGQEQLHPTTLPAVGALRDAGVEVLFATGRRYASARRGLDPLGLAGPAILLSGAVGADLATGEEWHRRSFDGDAAAAVWAAIRGHGLDPVTYVCDAEVDAIVGARCDTSPLHLAALGHPSPSDPHEALSSGRVVGFGLCGLDEAWAPTLGAIARELAGVAQAWEGPDHVIGGVTLMVGPSGVSKAVTVEAWCAARGITADQVLAVGDGSNDLELLDWAGTSVAVAGGAAEAHGADHVIPMPQDGGWAMLLDLP